MQVTCPPAGKLPASVFDSLFTCADTITHRAIGPTLGAFFLRRVHPGLGPHSVSCGHVAFDRYYTCDVARQEAVPAKNLT